MDVARKTVIDRFLSISQAAKELGKANATVLAMVVRGELQSELVAGRTVITRESVERYNASVAASPAIAVNG